MSVKQDYSTKRYHVQIGDGRIYVAGNPYTRCSNCKQEIKVGNVGADTWLDANGRPQGGWSHQHGCGQWNSPIETTFDFDEDEDGFDLDAAVEQAVKFWEDEVAEQRKLHTAATRQECLERLAEAAKVLREMGFDPNGPAPDDEAHIERIVDVYELRGIFDMVEPGLYWDDRVVAWGYAHFRLPEIDGEEGDLGMVEANPDDLPGFVYLTEDGAGGLRMHVYNGGNQPMWAYAFSAADDLDLTHDANAILSGALLAKPEDWTVETVADPKVDDKVVATWQFGEHGFECEIERDHLGAAARLALRIPEED